MELSLNELTMFSANIKDIASVFHVQEEYEFLSKFVTSSDIKECMDSGPTNLKRVEKLIKKMIQAENKNLYIAFVEYFDRKASICQKLHESLIKASQDTSPCITYSKPILNDEPTYILEKIQLLNEELQHWRLQSFSMLEVFSSGKRRSNETFPNYSSHWKHLKKPIVSIDEVMENFRGLDLAINSDDSDENGSSTDDHSSDANVIVFGDWDENGSFVGDHSTDSGSISSSINDETSFNQSSEPTMTRMELMAYIDKLIITLDKCSYFLATSFVDKDVQSKKKVVNVVTSCSDKLYDLYINYRQENEALANHFNNREQPECWTNILYCLNRFGIFRYADAYDSILLNMTIFSDFDNDFAKSLAGSSLLNLFYENLCMARYLNSSYKEYRKFLGIVLYILHTVHNICRIKGNTNYFEDSWKDVLHDVLSILEGDTPRILCLVTLGYLVDKRDDYLISVCAQVIPLCHEYIFTGITDSTHSLEEFCVAELLDGLSILTVHESMKYKFFEEFDEDDINKICEEALPIEIPAIVKILKNLCENVALRKELLNDGCLQHCLDVLQMKEGLTNEIKEDITSLLPTQP